MSSSVFPYPKLNTEYSATGIFLVRATAIRDAVTSLDIDETVRNSETNDPRDILNTALHDFISTEPRDLSGVSVLERGLRQTIYQVIARGRLDEVGELRDCVVEYIDMFVDRRVLKPIDQIADHLSAMCTEKSWRKLLVFSGGVVLERVLKRLNGQIDEVVILDHEDYMHGEDMMRSMEDYSFAVKYSYHLYPAKELLEGAHACLMSAEEVCKSGAFSSHPGARRTAAVCRYNRIPVVLIAQTAKFSWNSDIVYSEARPMDIGSPSNVNMIVTEIETISPVYSIVTEALLVKAASMPTIRYKRYCV